MTFRISHVAAATFAAIALVATMLARADVVDANSGSFVLRVERVVPVTPVEAYAGFLSVDRWWDKSHSWFGPGTRFRLEPRAGGCLCEFAGERSALHMTVSLVDPGRELRLLGGLGPLQGMALHGAMSFRFEQADSGQTRIVHEYRVAGYTKDGLQDLAPIVNAVQTGQIDRLVAWLAPRDQ